MAYQAIQGISTPLGRVVVDCREEGVLKVTVRPSDGRGLTMASESVDGALVTRYREAPRMPAEDEDVLIDGSWVHAAKVLPMTPTEARVMDDAGVWRTWRADA